MMTKPTPAESAAAIRMMLELGIPPEEVAEAVTDAHRRSVASPRKGASDA